MITKGEIVDTAVRKLVGDRETSLTGITPASYSKAIEDLEGLMAGWQIDGIDLLYNFAENHGTKAAAQQDSGLELWMKYPVAFNLALIIAPDFHRPASSDVISEASKGWRRILKKFNRIPTIKPAYPLPPGTGELSDIPGNQTESFYRGR